MSGFGEVHHYLREYGYLAVSVGLLLEHFGLPLPGETLLIAAAVLAARGVFDITLLLPLAWAAATVGNTIGFAIGRFGGHRLIARHGARIGITAERLQQVEAGFERYGAALLVVARFVIVLRQLSGIVAGTLAMKWGRFLFFNALGAALWVGWWGGISYWLGRRIFRFLGGLGRIEPALFALAGLALVVAVVVHFYWRRR